MRQALVSVLLCAALGCGSKAADPTLMQNTITTAVPNLVDELSTASTSLDSAQGVSSLRGTMHSLHTSFPGIPDLGGLGIGGQAGHDLADFLKQHVFTPANYEGDGVYLLHGADLCPKTAGGTPDADCVSKFDQVQFRIKAKAFSDDHVELTLLIGPTRLAPLIMTLSATSISLAVELADAKAALQYVAGIYGQSITLPAVLEGRISATYTRNAAQDLTFSFAVERSVRVEGTFPDMGGDYKFSTAARTPLFSVRVNGKARTISASVDVGPTSLQAPWQQVDPSSLTAGTMTIDLRGLTGAVTVADGATSVKLTGLGLGGGTSSLQLDGTSLLAVTLNPGSDGKFSLEVSPVAGAQPRIAVDPSFDLSLAFDLRKLRDAGDSIDPALVQDTYRVKFDGTTPTAQPIDSTSTFEGGLKVISGQIAISSAASSQTVTVHAGKCLVGDDPVTAGENAITGRFAERDCP
jgi:hypothetical protein